MDKWILKFDITTYNWFIIKKIVFCVSMKTVIIINFIQIQLQLLGWPFYWKNKIAIYFTVAGWSEYISSEFDAKIDHVTCAKKR